MKNSATTAKSSKNALTAAQIRGIAGQTERRPDQKQSETELQPLNLNRQARQKKSYHPKQTKRKQRAHSAISPCPQALSVLGRAADHSRSQQYPNDRLTLRQAAKDHLWLHVKDATSTHVIINHKQEEIPTARSKKPHAASPPGSPAKPAVWPKPPLTSVPSAMCANPKAPIPAMSSTTTTALSWLNRWTRPLCENPRIF